MQYAIGLISGLALMALIAAIYDKDMVEKVKRIEKINLKIWQERQGFKDLYHQVFTEKEGMKHEVEYLQRILTEKVAFGKQVGGEKAESCALCGKKGRAREAMFEGKKVCMICAAEVSRNFMKYEEVR